MTYDPGNQYPGGQQNPGGYPPPGYGQYPQPGAQGTNGMAIAGFVLAFFCSLLGLIFSIIGLNQAKARGQGGQGLAIAGIVISLLGLVVAVAILANR
jgi:hypothetical protein